jgi:hypothetical protein
MSHRYKPRHMHHCIRLKYAPRNYLYYIFSEPAPLIGEQGIVRQPTDRPDFKFADGRVISRRHFLFLTR